jgi:metal-sulfur cluster biosynthetic enzyme
VTAVHDHSGVHAPRTPAANNVAGPAAHRDAVWSALGTVHDPELDQPITDLGFVREASTDGEQVRVRLRLPTYFCAPNFAYLMVADAHDALAALPGMSTVDVMLTDHFAADEINAGIAEGAGFSDSFPRQASGELSDLRRTFNSKAHLACLERAAKKLMAAGVTAEELPGLTLADLPESPERTSLLRRRAQLGLSTAPDATLLVDSTGTPVPPQDVVKRLRYAMSVRVSIEGNAEFCSGLLRTRYSPDLEDTSGPNIDRDPARVRQAAKEESPS